MPLLEIVIIALALSMDAFAVTISNCCAYPNSTRAQRLAMPIVFGVFQGLMPIIGFFLGSLVAGFIQTYAGFIALLILGIIGGRMIWEGSKALLQSRKTAAEPTSDDSLHGPTISETPPEDSPRKLGAPVLLLQGIATSIDALIVGVSFLAMGANIFIAAPLVALVTFACCLLAVFLGSRFGRLLGNRAEIVGGIILVLIGIKALF